MDSSIQPTTHQIECHGHDTAIAAQHQQADSDSKLIALWLFGKAKNTQDAYQREIQRFTEWVQIPLRDCKLGDLQQYLAGQWEKSLSTQARTTNALKSLFSFAHRLGYVPFNVAAPLKAPKAKDTLAERILSPEQVKLIFDNELNPRNRAMMRLLYAGALRVSELCDLKWRDLQPREEGGQITVFGKGSKTGVVLLPPSIWDELLGLSSDRSPDQYVFPGSGGKMHRSTAWRIVNASAERVGLKASPHYFRHAHASNSLEAGADIGLVRETLRHGNVATTSRYIHARPGKSSSSFLSL